MISSPVSGQLGATDSPTVDLTLTGNGTTATPYGLSAAVKVDPADGNVLSAGAGGLRVACSDVLQCIPPENPVTSGCGITGNGAPATPLKINGLVAWPYSCPEAQGQRVYCGTGGRLLVDPPQRCVTGEVALGAQAAADGFCRLVPNNNTEKLISDQPSRLTITNPDPCRSMILQIDTGGELRMDSDGATGLWSNQLLFRLVVNNVDRGIIERLGIGTQGVLYSQNPAPLITLAAGGKATIGTRLYGVSVGGCHVVNAHYKHPHIRVIGRTCI